MTNLIEQAAKIIREGIEDVRDEPHLSDAEHAKMVAEVLAESGLLATREEWSAAYYGVTADGTRTLNLIGTEGTRDHAEDTRDDCAKDDPGTRFILARRGYTEWEAVE